MAARNIAIYGDRDEAFFLEHFMPSTAVGDPTKWVERALRLGDAAKPILENAHLDISYGPSPLQTFDVFPAAEKGAPLAVYFHGGYWMAYDKANYRYIPAMLVPEGVTTVLANYDLCPNVTVDDIVAQARACVGEVYRRAEEFGADPNKLHVLGSSAGGQLTAMVIAHDFEQDGLPRGVVKGALSITGVHRLEPVLSIPVNDDTLYIDHVNVGPIHLTHDMAFRNSTLDKPPVHPLPVHVAVGGDEPSEWIRMSVDYDTMLREAGHPGDLFILPGENHFSVTQNLAKPDSVLSKALLDLIQWTSSKA